MEAFQELFQTEIGRYDLQTINKLKEVLESGQVFKKSKK